MAMRKAYNETACGGGSRRRDLLFALPVVLDSLLLARDEFRSAVDASQVEDVVPHRRFQENRQVAAGGDRNDDLAHSDAETLFLRCGDGLLGGSCFTIVRGSP